MNPMQDQDLTQALAHGLTVEEYKRAIDSLGRTPNLTELGVISVLWSEHCSYKSSRVHLKRLITRSPRVIQGPGENAGVVDIGDGWAAVFKMESHNHPSFIEPYQGAATGVGGILRDVFTMGARPVALLNSLRFGSPENPRTQALLRGVVAGLAGYGNAIGVPTVGGELQFDSAYDNNILVNAFALGVCRTSEVFYGRAKGVGNAVVYVGAKTGRDGIHGATMASAEFDTEKESRRPTVQVGDPFTEKLLLEACLEVFSQGLIEGVQDMGAAGLTSSIVEMASRADTGIELWLDRVPRRARALSPYEILLSESQERMVFVARQDKVQEIIDRCARWDLDAVVIGRVTDTRRFVVRATAGFDPIDGETPPEKPEETDVCVDLPVGLLTHDAPVYDRPASEDPRPKELWELDLPSRPFDPRVDLIELLGSPNVGSREWVWRQFDHIVRNGTVVRPGQADAAVIRVICEDGPARRDKLLALAADCNGRVCALDPRTGAALAVAEACRNLACVGAEPIGVTDCLNFGNPERPEVMAQLRDAIDGITDACRVLGVPVVSGNVSLYNETLVSGEARAVLPTPVIGAVGLVRQASDVLTAGFRTAGDNIYLLGSLTDGESSLGGSEWLTRRAGKVCGRPPSIDLPFEGRLQRFLLEAARNGLIASAHDCSDGGLLVAIAESCVLGRLGATIALPIGVEPSPGVLFGEAPSRVVVSVTPWVKGLFDQRVSEARLAVTPLGVVGGAMLSLEGIFTVGLNEMIEARDRALEGIVGED